MKHVSVVYRERPFQGPVHHVEMPVGLTLSEMVDRIPGLPASFDRRGVILVNESPVPREMWPRVRPKAVEGRDIVVNMVPIVLQDGDTWRAVASVAVVVAAIAISAGALGPAATALGAAGWFAAGSTSAAVLAGAVSIGSALALSALSAPPSVGAVGASSAGVDQKGGTASLSGNVLRPGGPIPRVVGTKRVWPPAGCNPLIEIVDDDEVAEGVFVLAGPHQIEEPRNGDTLISEIDEIEIETREGFDDDAALTLVTRQSKSDQCNIELSRHKVEKDGNSNTLEDQVNPVNSCPKYHSILLRKSPDEVWLPLYWNSGLLFIDDPNEEIAVPIRVRIRELGTSAWTRIPEIHFRSRGSRPMKKAIKLMWQASPGSPPVPKQYNAPYYATKAVPMRVTAYVGNFNNQSFAFDGDVAGGSGRAASSGYIGADFSAWPRPVTYFQIFPRPSNGFSISGTVTVKLYGKTGSAPANSSDGTVLYTYSGADTTSPLSGTPSDTTTAWSYVWVEIVASSGSEIYCYEIKLFDDGDFAWIANSYFSAGTTQEYTNTADAATTSIQNIALYGDRAEVYLNPATFPKGDYEIQIIRGQGYSDSAFSESTYANGGDVRDFFRWRILGGDFETSASQKSYVDDTFLPRVSRIWNEPVLAAPGLAAIAIKVRNRSIENINVLASGYVNKWDGSNWDDLDISSNPADHYRDVLVGNLNASALPVSIIDDDNLVDWRALCVTNDWTVNFVAEGRSVFDLLTVIAGCGYARPRQSEKWGVMIDSDRSAEAPVQIFSPANMRAFGWEKAFPRLPCGFRVRYDDADNAYEEAEEIVLRPGAVDDGRYEDIRYDGLVANADAIARAEFDLEQPVLRPTFYRGEAPVEWIVATRGDLVGVQYDVIADVSGAARIKQIVTSGSPAMVTQLVLNAGILGSSQIFFNNEGDEEFFDNTGSEEFFLDEGTIGAAIRLKDGSLMTEEITVDEEDDHVVDLVTPFLDPGSSILDVDCLVVTGPLGQEYKRMIVADITAREDFTAAITFVDEAPELHAA